MGGAGGLDCLRRCPPSKMTWTHYGTTFTPRSRRPCPTARRNWPMCWPTPSVPPTAELPDGFQFDCALPDGRYLEVETHKPDNGVDKLLVAVCNANTRGVAFGKQISELENRAGEIPVAIVRTTDFPKSGKAIDANRRHAETARAKGGRRRRRMAANAGVRGVPQASTRQRPDFAAWQKAARPLGELDSLQKILKLSALAAVPPAPVAPPPPVVRTRTGPTRLRTAPRGSGSGRAAECGAARSRPHPQRDAGPGDIRAERVRPTCGVPGRVGQRQDDGGAEPDRTTARPRRARRAP